MAQQKKKKESEHVLAKRAMEAKYAKAGKTLYHMAGVSGKGLESYYAAFDQEGIKIYQYKNQLNLKQELNWSEFTHVNIDHFALKSVFQFSGNGNNEKLSVVDVTGKQVEEIIRQHTSLEVTNHARKWYQKILGFRSGKKWKMITAGIVYFIILFSIIGAFAGGEDEQKAASNPPKQEVKKETPAVAKKPEEEAEKKKKKEAEAKKELLQFEGSMNMKVVNDKAILVEVKTNAPDGAIFETSILNGDFNVQSDFLEVKNGKISKEFTLPDDWEVGYVAGTAMFRFNLPDHPQPDHIKNIYGEKGEKMTGELASENNEGGQSATLKTKTIPYPDKKTVQAKMDETFNDAIEELKSTTDGIIVDVYPRSAGDWSSVNVVVSDVWYYSADHEKERFAEQMGQAVENLITGNEKAEGSIFVYFVDTYGKELAKPKVLGGYKIKK